MIFTQEEIRFLTKHGFTEDDVFDGRSLPKAEIKSQSDKAFYIGSECAKSGHRLRTRSGGHCVQCDTSKISHQKRFSANEYVYIAASKTREWIKIGTTKDVEERKITLNKDGYAGAEDWEILLSFKAEKSGRVEKEIQKELSVFASAQSFSKGGKQRDTQEVFTCSFSTAYKALNNVGCQMALVPTEAWKHPNAETYASFQDKKGTGFVRKGNTGSE